MNLLAILKKYRSEWRKRQQVRRSTEHLITNQRKRLHAVLAEHSIAASTSCLAAKTRGRAADALRLTIIETVDHMMPGKSSNEPFV